MDEYKLQNEQQITGSGALNNNWDRTPDKAHDKNVTTFYRSAIKTEDTPTQYSWIELSLIADVEIGIVAIVNRLGIGCLKGCSKRLQNTRVEAFNTVRTVQKACGLVDGVDGYDTNLGEGSEADETYFVDCCGVQASVVRLTDVDNIPNEMNVAEVRIYKAKKGSDGERPTGLIMIKP